jgi:hypothetical protein
MKKRTKICLTLMAMPLVGVLVFGSVFDLLGCHAGAGGSACTYAPNWLGDALFGISMACAFGGPLVIFVSMFFLLIGTFLDFFEKKDK